MPGESYPGHESHEAPGSESGELPMTDTFDTRQRPHEQQHLDLGTDPFDAVAAERQRLERVQAIERKLGRRLVRITTRTEPDSAAARSARGKQLFAEAIRGEVKASQTRRRRRLALAGFTSDIRRIEIGEDFRSPIRKQSH